MNLTLNSPCMMGILNVTPDSFSDRGQLQTPEALLQRARDAIDAGVQILDIGGESTRPGAKTIPETEELQRVLPAIQRLHAAFPQVCISIDTRKAAVAEQALKAGANLVNDVSGLQYSGAEMVQVIVKHRAKLVLMHSQGEPETMQHSPHYQDVVQEVGEFFETQLSLAKAWGLSRDQVILDPGFGFGKTLAHNLALLTDLHELKERFNLPLLVGSSRKSFLTLGKTKNLAPDQREALTAASLAIAYEQGASLFRVHDWQTQGPVLALLAASKAAGTSREPRPHEC